MSIRSTGILAVTASGDKLRPFLIYKGVTNGTLRKRLNRGDDSFSSGVEYGVQPNAWADENLTLEYIRKVKFS